MLRAAAPAARALAAGWCIAFAPAATGAEKGITAPPLHDGRSIVPELRQLNADFLVVSASWAVIAPRPPERATDPDDPAYDWSALDPVVREAGRNGIDLIPIVQSTPRWANGDHGPNVGPTDVGDYARFLIAMSRRYPQIKRWMIWGEPSKLSQWAPQGARGARRYAQLLDRAYSALKVVDPRDEVIGGNTYCCGRDDATSTSARTWLNDLRLVGGRRPRLDLWGMNPYGERPIDVRASPLNDRFMDYNDLDTLAALLDRAYPGRRVPIFIAESGTPTERGNIARPFFATREEQASRMRRLFALVDGLPRVAAIANYLLYDQPELPDARGRATGWTTGLRTVDGVKKPAWNVFRRLAAASSAAAPRRVRLSAGQLAINQRIAQAAVRRAAAVEAWLNEGVTTRDLAGGGLTEGDFGPDVAFAATDATVEVRPADPRPLEIGPPTRLTRGGRIGLSARQLLINQRISQAALRRANALARRLDGGLTGGDVRDGTIVPAKIRPGLVVTAAAVGAPPPPPSATQVVRRRAPRGAISLSAAQLRINQRIGQAAVRRANALSATIASGLTGDNFRDGTLTAADLAPGMLG